MAVLTNEEVEKIANTKTVVRKQVVLDLVESIREARQLYRGLLQQIKDAPVHVVYCVYCGHEYPAGTPQAKAQVLTDHIAQCEEHPMRELVAMAEALDAWNENMDHHDIAHASGRFPDEALRWLAEWKKKR